MPSPAAKFVTGNFDGAGFDEIAALYDYTNCTAAMLVFTSTGTGIAGGTWTRPWYQPVAGNWCWSASTVLSGDFVVTTGRDGQPDGKADVAVVYNHGGGVWKVELSVDNHPEGVYTIRVI